MNYFQLDISWHEIAHWNHTRSLKSLRFSYLSTRCRSVSSRFPAGVGHIHSLGDMVRRGAWRLRVGRFEIPNSYWRSWNHISNMLRKMRETLGNLGGLKWQVGKGARESSLLLFRWAYIYRHCCNNHLLFLLFLFRQLINYTYLPLKMSRCWYCILVHACSRSRLWRKYWVQGYCQLFVHLYNIMYKYVLVLLICLLVIEGADKYIREQSSHYEPSLQLKPWSCYWPFFGFFGVQS